MLRRLSDGTVIDVDDDALDENGVLRDGHRMRVPLRFRDSARRTTATLRFADGRTDVSVGSRPGFVIDASGLIVTNNHVVEGAESIEVHFQDSTILKAELVGRDPKTDLAVIRVKSETPLPVVEKAAVLKVVRMSLAGRWN